MLDESLEETERERGEGEEIAINHTGWMKALCHAIVKYQPKFERESFEILEF